MHVCESMYSMYVCMYVCMYDPPSYLLFCCFVLFLQTLEDGLPFLLLSSGSPPLFPVHGSLRLPLMDHSMTSPKSPPPHPQRDHNPPPHLPPLSAEQPMKFIDFKVERADARCVQGRFVVSEKSCQPFNVLHGGVSAMIAESLASSGAYIASGLRRVAGVELNINHLKAAPVGTEVLASAEPVHLGKRLHVWNVTLWKVSRSDEKVEAYIKIAVARVTVMVGLDRESSEPNENQKPSSRL